MIQNSIDGEELYVLADGDEIAACVIANDEKVDGYGQFVIRFSHRKS